MSDPRLHPEIVAVLEAKRAAGQPAMETLAPAAARALACDGLAALQGPPEPVDHVENLTVAGGIPLRVYRPKHAGPMPALVYFHGGGWVVCDLETHDVMCRRIANEASAVVVAVDYRLAPEHPFPAAVEDAFRAFEWVAANAARFGIDPARIAVGGDSAGGNLAAVVAIKARDAGGPHIALQVLIYPVTNLAVMETPLYLEFAAGYGLTKPQMEWFRAHYLPHAKDALNPDASPLLAEDLARLPRALVITAECDPLRDEGEAYARRLSDAGTPVVAKRYYGMIHPFFSMPAVVGDARHAISQIAAALNAMA